MPAAPPGFFTWTKVEDAAGICLKRDAHFFKEVSRQRQQLRLSLGLRRMTQANRTLFASSRARQRLDLPLTRLDEFTALKRPARPSDNWAKALSRDWRQLLGHLPDFGRQNGSLREQYRNDELFSQGLVSKLRIRVDVSPGTATPLKRLR